MSVRGYKVRYMHVRFICYDRIVDEYARPNVSCREAVRTME